MGKIDCNQYSIAIFFTFCSSNALEPLPHECEDLTKYAWGTPLNAQCNIEYRSQYSFILYFFKLYHRNRLFLYFLMNYRISIISLLFCVSIPTLGSGYRSCISVSACRPHKMVSRATCNPRCLPSPGLKMVKKKEIVE